MSDEMRPLLNAYLDGELHGVRLQQLQVHLVTCAECREELEELRSLSTLLHAAPSPQAMPVDRFVANLTLNLPRRPQVERPRRSAGWVWWLVPAGLLFAWFFVQTVFTLSSVLSLASRADLLGSTSALLAGGAEHSLWFDALSGLVGNQTGTSLAAFSFLDQLSVFGSGLLTWLLVQAVIVLLYWAWLAAWWLNRRPQIMQGSAGLPQP